MHQQPLQEIRHRESLVGTGGPGLYNRQNDFRGLYVTRRIAAFVVAASIAGAVVVPVARQTSVFPGTMWETATPESQGLASAPFDALDEQIRTDVYGNVDRLLVVRARPRRRRTRRYARDYRAISRGRTGPIGCGEGCTDPAAMHEFNYFHPELASVLPGPRRAHAAVGHQVDRRDRRSASRSAAARSPRSMGRSCRSSRTATSRASIARLRRATLADLLTMRSGIEWHEQDRPLDETNTTVQLERSQDWIQFTLEPADGRRSRHEVGVQQRRQPADVRHHPHRHRPLHRRLRERAPVPAARHRDFHWKKTPTGHPGHRRRPVPRRPRSREDRLPLPARRDVERPPHPAGRLGEETRRHDTRRRRRRAGTTAISGG